MVTSCCAIKCTNRFKKGSAVTFHSFPLKNPELVKQWCEALRRDNFVPSKYHSLCSEHFTEDAFRKGYVNIRKLKEDAIPTKFNFPDLPSRLKKRVKKQPESVSLANMTTSKERYLGVDCKSVHPLTMLVEKHKLEEERLLAIAKPLQADHSYGISDSPRDIKTKFERILERREKQLQMTKVKLKLTSAKVLRLKEKMLRMGTARIKHDRHINNTNYTPIAKEVIERIQKGDKSGEYSEALQLFALTLYSCSPIAYDYVRESFGFCLPHVSTVRNWRKNVTSKRVDNVTTP